jgi:hypothetical protein
MHGALMSLTFRFELFAIRLVEFMFFAGVIGCAVAIFLSWISILRDGLTEDD